ncbi:hypothetical protein GIB67_006169 [Kingdonia uniflora]|uniref:Uncharacterized protein n=1 Tax=Kingdonia uniflora TaxID=39325 RepID=A0A7J7LPX3_9MAGN|nr:hypothetical protein GIB67_006169 [Kingdonia uniflora]
MGNIDLFGPTALRADIIPVVVTLASVHSLSKDFSLPSDLGGLDSGWHMEWTGRREPVRNAWRLQELKDKLVIAHKQIDIIEHQLYAHDLQLRWGRDIRVVPLPLGGGARTRQRRSGPRTRGGGTCRRGRGTGDDYE